MKHTILALCDLSVLLQFDFLVQSFRDCWKAGREGGRDCTFWQGVPELCCGWEEALLVNVGPCVGYVQLIVVAS